MPFSLRCLLCGACVEPYSQTSTRPESRRRKRFLKTNPARTDQGSLVSMPRPTNDNHRPALQPSPSSEQAERSPTPSLTDAFPELQSQPSPDFPEADQDAVAGLVRRLQRKVITFVETLGLPDGQERSRARSRIYFFVIDLVKSEKRNADECELRNRSDWN